MWNGHKKSGRKFPFISFNNCKFDSSGDTIMITTGEFKYCSHNVHNALYQLPNHSWETVKLIRMNIKQNYESSQKKTRRNRIWFRYRSILFYVCVKEKK